MLSALILDGALICVIALSVNAPSVFMATVFASLFLELKRKSFFDRTGNSVRLAFLSRHDKKISTP